MSLWENLWVCIWFEPRWPTKRCPNMKQQIIIMSNNYRRPILSKLMGYQEQQTKAHQIWALLLSRKMYEKKYKNFVWGTQQQNLRKKLSLKSCLVILKEDMLFRAFVSSKPGYFNSLRGNFYCESVTMKLIEEKSQCQNKVLRLFLTFLTWQSWNESWSSWASRHCCRNSSKIPAKLCTY